MSVRPDPPSAEAFPSVDPIAPNAAAPASTEISSASVFDSGPSSANSVPAPSAAGSSVPPVGVSAQSPIPPLSSSAPLSSASSPPLPPPPPPPPLSHRRATPSTSSFAPPTVVTSTPRADRIAPSLVPTPTRRPRAVSLMALVQDPPTLPDLSGAIPNLDLGRVCDWRNITVGSIVNPDEARFVSSDSTIEEATKILINGGSPNVVLVTDDLNSRIATGTFDYSDLNTYLLGVVDRAQANGGTHQPRQPDYLRDLPEFDRREPLITLPADALLPQALEFLASGVHRIVVTEGGESDSHRVIGVLTQLRLVRFFYDNRKNFPDLTDLYSRSLVDLNVGNHEVVSIRGHLPLLDALKIINSQGVTSIPVLDKDDNVIGNLSHVDTRLLIRESSLPQFDAPCTSFISVIVSERGIEDGKDSFPVFYVNPFFSLAFTVAKLLATRSHRLWVVNNPSPSPSLASTPSLGPALPQTPLFQQRPSISSAGAASISPISATSSARRPSVSVPNISSSTGPSAMPSPQFSHTFGNPHSLSGRLDGVVSLTDVLNLFARACNLHTSRPDGARRLWHRRRSSSSSASSRMSATAPFSGHLPAGTVPAGAAIVGGYDGGVSRIAGRDRSVSTQSRASNVSYNAPPSIPPPGRR